MDVIYSNDNILKDKFTGVGLGNFDGLHIGHMALINTLIAECKIRGVSSLLYTFLKHPDNFLRKGLFTPLLTTVNKKTRLLEETLLDYIYFDEFNERFSRMEPEAFVRDILVNKLHAKVTVAGFNYRFGYRGQGDINLLKEMGKSYNFNVIVIPPIKVENQVVSSTLIREYVSKGSMDRVFKLLGRHYSLTGKVSSGKRIGNELGFPTANIYPEDYLILPREGVYATRTLIDGKLYGSVTNIGRNPTFGIGDKISVETHILNFYRDIYDRDIEVFFISKIRDEKKFKDKEELVNQISRDVQCAKNILS